MGVYFGCARRSLRRRRARKNFVNCRMRKIFLLLLAASAAHGLKAQSDYLTLKTFAARGGEVVIAHYKNNIYKITYKLNGSTHNEAVSDAVVLKRRPMGPPFEARVSGDTVYIGNRPFVVKAFAGADERGLYFPLAPNEMIFGAGERALPLNRRGYRLNLYNNPWYGYSEGADNLNYSVPFITSSNGYGLFFDNPSRGALDIGKTDSSQIRYTTASGELTVYVIPGDYRQVLQAYYRLTGTQPLPPRWAFGNLMSRFGYTSEKQVTNIAAQMKSNGLPIDAVIFDLFWFGDSIKGTMGNLDWVNKKAWPDPQRMIADFKKDGVHTILVTEPFFLASTKNYAAAKPYLATDSAGRPYELTDFYFGRGGLVDIFRQDAQQWFWQFYKRQMAIGVDGWWGDLGEPEKHPANLYHNLRDLGHKRLFSADEVHNIYGHNWTKMLYLRYAKEAPGQRLFSLNRAGFAGSQRYSIFPWTGDVSRSWSGFRAQLPVLLGMSMSGVPYVHSDAGGFAGGEGDNELYVRWLQFAVYTPIFRPHGTALFEKDTAAFSFPSEAALIDTNFRTYAKAAIGQRYRLLPYNYSLGFDQALKGEPLMSPLYYYFGNDTAAVRVEDEYMWGENILVAPILQKGAQRRRYYLPEGDWYDAGRGLWRSKGWHEDNVSLAELPVFYRAGSFIPTIDFPATAGAVQLSNTAAYRGDRLVITYVESADSSSYELYDDDGSSRSSLDRKQFEELRFTSTGRSNNRLMLSIKSNGGRYPGRPAVRHLVLSLALRDKKIPGAILVDGRPSKTKFQTGNGLLVFPIDFTGRPVSITFTWPQQE